MTSYAYDHYRLLGGEELSDAERDELLALCRQRLDAFRAQAPVRPGGGSHHPQKPGRTRRPLQLPGPLLPL